jgi:lipoate-protein ligase A
MAEHIMHQNVDDESSDPNPLDPEAQLARDWALFRSVENGTFENLYRCWHASRPVVVVGRNSHIDDDVIEDACRADGVPVLRRFSGGGAVVLAPGCLNYAMVLSYVSRPELTGAAGSFEFILRHVVAALRIPGLSLAAGTDLALGDRKVSGNAQRRGRRALIHHGTLLHGFDRRLASRYLKEPACQPAYRKRRHHAEFIGNLPLSPETIRARLETAWRALRGDSPRTERGHLHQGAHVPRESVGPTGGQGTSTRVSSHRSRRSPSSRPTRPPT